VKRRDGRVFCADRARYTSAHSFAKKFLSTSKRVRKSCSSKVSSGFKLKHIWARCQVLLQETYLTIRLKLTIVVREVPIMISEILYRIRCDKNGFPVRVSLEKRSTRVLSIDCTEQLHHPFHSLQGSRNLTCKESWPPKTWLGQLEPQTPQNQIVLFRAVGNRRSLPLHVQHRTCLSCIPRWCYPFAWSSSRSDLRRFFTSHERPTKSIVLLPVVHWVLVVLSSCCPVYFRKEKFIGYHSTVMNEPLHTTFSALADSQPALQHTS
jgi:hypothetical protein